MVLDVVKHPNSALKEKSQKATFNGGLTSLIQNMRDTINSFTDPAAAGLSAIQVGVPTRILIARDFGETSPEQLMREYVLINPKWISNSKDKELDWEGCLSFPDLYGKVWRSKKVKVKYQDAQGGEQRLTASGFLARVIQHEMDHLDGITFDTKIVGGMRRGSELEVGVKVRD